MWEVVYPTSRAVELGAEDDEEEKCIFQSTIATPVVRMSNELQSNGKTVSCKLLVLAFDRIPTTFIEAHFINNGSQIVGLVSSGNIKEGCTVINSLQQTASSDKTCFIHSARSNEVLFCQCKVDVPAEACHNWANEVLSCIKADKVLILSTLPVSVCSLNCDVNSDHMFALKTDSWKTNIDCQFLPLPNIVSNLPAAEDHVRLNILALCVAVNHRHSLLLATRSETIHLATLVLTHCQIFNIPTVMYVAVTATDSGLDSSVIEIFNTLIECEPLKDLPKRSKTETARFLKSLKITYPHLENNMYI